MTEEMRAMLDERGIGEVREELLHPGEFDKAVAMYRGKAIVTDNEMFIFGVLWRRYETAVQSGSD